MKRLQIMIDVDLDEALAVEARRTNTSKAELIRRYVRESLGSSSDSRDRLKAMIGVDDYEPAGIDEVVYR